MELDLFLVGALGALLTIYLGKQEVVPEFRPLFDVSQKEKDATRYRDRIRKTERDIDNIQSKLQEESLSADLAQRLTTVLESSRPEINDGRERLQSLEYEIKQSQVISRILGFFFYIALGGFFGSLLADRVQVQGLIGDLPNYFESLVIGATWTSYLSTIGFRSGQRKADERIEAVRKEFAEQINTTKREITETVTQGVAKAETTDKVDQPVLADAIAKIVGDKLDLASLEMESNLAFARQMVQRDFKGVL